MVVPFGPDVSSHQGHIDWNKVASNGCSFAFTKATQGIDYVNPTFGYNWKNINGAAMYRASYDFSMPSTCVPELEAQFHYTTVSNEGIEKGDILALDLEEYEGNFVGVQVNRWALDYLEALESLCGFPPVLYTTESVIVEYDLSDPAFGRYGLWLASWSSKRPVAPDPWEFWAFWQYTDSGRLAGIQGNVDLNQFNGPADRIPLHGKP